MSAVPPDNDRRYESYSYEELRAEVEQGNDPQDAGELGRGWSELARQLEESIDGLVAMSTGSEHAWSGDGGEAVRRVLAAAATWSAGTATASRSVGDAVARQAEAAARARAELPEPVSYDPAGLIRDALASGSVGLLAGLSDAMSARAAESERAREKAVDVLYARDEALRSAVPDVAFADPPPLTSGPA